MIDTFLSKFGVTNLDFIQIENKYYLADEKLQELNKKINRKPSLIGLYLGENKDEKFNPSMALLDIISKTTNEKVIIKDIGENDFLYGKKLRPRHVAKVEGTLKEGFLKIVVNDRNECLGLAKIKDIAGTEFSLKNVLDAGDFLRREK